MYHNLFTLLQALGQGSKPVVNDTNNMQYEKVSFWEPEIYDLKIILFWLYSKLSILFILQKFQKSECINLVRSQL